MCSREEIFTLTPDPHIRNLPVSYVASLLFSNTGARIQTSCSHNKNRPSPIFVMCSREDLNLQPLRDMVLSHARMPVPPREQVRWYRNQKIVFVQRKKPFWGFLQRVLDLITESNPTATKCGPRLQLHTQEVPRQYRQLHKAIVFWQSPSLPRLLCW